MEKVSANFKKIVLISFGFLFCIVFCEISNCTSGWFGSECQYMCHCRSGVICDAKGQCQDGHCDQGWFGPGCQYVDLSHGRKPAHLSDDVGSFCSKSTGQINVKIKFNNPYPFTWIRVHTNNSEFLHSMNIAFRNDSSLSCVNQRKALVDDRTLDIYCDMSERIQYVTLTGDGVQYLCSLYISGGRNVALRQNTSQSSTYVSGKQSYTSDKAVDGIRPGYSFPDNCSITNVTEKSSTWTLRFSKPRNVSRYLIYGNDYYFTDYPWFTSRGVITLESFDVTGNRMFNYTYRKLYYYDLSDFEEIQSNTSQVASMTIQGPEQLQLCEVEVYGDSACQPKWYGRDCEHRCNCAGDGTCFVSTGGCPSGCADGYTGEACDKPCERNTWGRRCAYNCSQFCARSSNTTDNPCDIVNGSCLLGCNIGYRMPNCTEACKPGTYGPECNFKCSEFCAKETTLERSCDFVNGTCLLGCVSGYEGQTCEKPCWPGRYGANCNSSCSEMCEPANSTMQSACDTDTGHCLNGCLVGYTGPACRAESFSADTASPNTPLIVGISIAVAVVIITLGVAAAAVVYRRKRTTNSLCNIPVKACEDHLYYCDVPKSGTASKTLHKPMPADKTKSSELNSSTHEDVNTPSRIRDINQAHVGTVRNQVDEIAEHIYANEFPLYDEIPDNIYCNVRNETAVYCNV